MFSATLSDNEYEEQRPGQTRSAASLVASRINSTQFFSLATLLFIATGIEAYFAQGSPSSRRLPLGGRDADALFSLVQYLAYGVSDVLSPLMILSCTVAATGALVRGVELVIQATAFKGR